MTLNSLSCVLFVYKLYAVMLVTCVPVSHTVILTYHKSVIMTDHQAASQSLVKKMA